MKPLVLLALCLVLGGCLENNLRLVDIGRIVKVEVIPTSFNEMPKMLVTTDRGIYVIRDYYSYIIGNYYQINEKEIYQ